MFIRELAFRGSAFVLINALVGDMTTTDMPTYQDSFGVVKPRADAPRLRLKE